MLVFFLILTVWQYGVGHPPVAGVRIEASAEACKADAAAYKAKLEADPAIQEVTAQCGVFQSPPRDKV